MNVSIHQTELVKLIPFGEGIEFLGISATTAWHWERQNKIKVHRIGRKRFFHADELNAAITGGNVPTNRETVTVEMNSDNQNKE